MFFLSAVFCIHLILCAMVIHILSKKRIYLTSSGFPLAFLCLLFGPICILMFLRYKKKKGATIDAEETESREEKEIYRLFGFEKGGELKTVSAEENLTGMPSDSRGDIVMELIKEDIVSFEDAMTVSASDVRRKLMMDILNSDTASFYDLLEEARLDHDTEVVHYAATAMSELGKKYDNRLEKYERLHRESPDDIGILYDFCECLRQYLKLGMLTGRGLEVRRKTYIALLLELNEKQKTYENCRNLAEQYMLSENYIKADTVISDMEKQWSDREENLILRLEYAVRTGNGEQMKKLTESVAERNNYIGEETCSLLSFWAGHDIRRENEESGA